MIDLIYVGNPLPITFLLIKQEYLFRTELSLLVENNLWLSSKLKSIVKEFGGSKITPSYGNIN